MLKFALWLIPSEKKFNLLSSCILHNSKLAGCPYFMPHMTLFCGAIANKDLLRARFENFRLLTKKLDLNVKINDVKSGHEFYKSHYIDFYMNDSLKALYCEARKLDENSAYILKPHISLHYGATEMSLLSIDSLINEIHFDQLVIMSDTEIASYEAIQSWKPILI